MTKFYVVGPNKEFADVVVMLKGVPAKAADASAPAVLIDQKNCLYVPQIVAIQTGQKLLVKNSDPMPVAMHNVHINPTAASNFGAGSSSAPPPPTPPNSTPRRWRVRLTCPTPSRPPRIS